MQLPDITSMSLRMAAKVQEGNSTVDWDPGYSRRSGIEQIGDEERGLCRVSTVVR